MAWKAWSSAVLWGLLAVPAWAGSVAGVVRYRGPALAAPAALEVTKDRPTCGESVPDETLLVTEGLIQNAVVTVKGPPAPPPTDATLDQRRCRYVPHVQVVPPGSTLHLANGDPILHSNHGWAGRVTRFDVVTPEQGARVPTRLDRPGPVQVRCDVHGWMSAWVVVADGPAAVTDARGEFTVRDVPPGRWTLRVWHERLGERTVEVTVPPQGEARVQVELAPAGGAAG